MFNNRAFNTAFFISLAWHIFWMSAVNVVVLPGKYRARDLSSVSFLGPILEETALQIMLVNKPAAVTTRYQHDIKYTHHLAEKEELPLRDEARDRAKIYVSANAEESIGSSLGVSFRKTKEIPNIVKGISKDATHPDSPSAISGDIAKRELIYKPKKPKLPSWITASVPFLVELDFCVSPQGEVKEVVPAVSSGNPEVDLLGIRYLKRWKFAPLAQNRNEEQRGRVKFIFGANP